MERALTIFDTTFSTRFSDVVSTFNFLLLSFKRQFYPKRRPRANLALHLDRPPVLLHNRVSDGEAEAGALVFARVKRIEDMGQLVLRDPTAGVGD